MCMFLYNGREGSDIRDSRDGRAVISFLRSFLSLAPTLCNWIFIRDFNQTSPLSLVFRVLVDIGWDPIFT